MRWIIEGSTLHLYTVKDDQGRTFQFYRLVTKDHRLMKLKLTLVQLKKKLKISILESIKL